MTKAIIYLSIFIAFELQSTVVVCEIPQCGPNGLISGQSFCLFENYSGIASPLEVNEEGEMKIEADVDVMDIYIDEESMSWITKLLLTLVWTDSRILAVDDTTLALNQDIINLIWLPHLITNSHESLAPPFIRENSLGLYILRKSSAKITKVKAIMEITFTNSCPQMSFWNFPFDGFECEFFLRHRTLDASKAELSGNITIRDDLRRPTEFDLEGSELAFVETNFRGTNFSVSGFSVSFQRKFGIYVNRFYAPLVLFVASAFIGFLIPPLEGNDRMCMLITLFLVNVQMSLYISDNSPNSDSPTALDVFVTAMNAFIFATIIEYLVILLKIFPIRNEPKGDAYEKVLSFARKADKISIFLFPILFSIFIIIYLIYYGFSNAINIRAGLSSLKLSK